MADATSFWWGFGAGLLAGVAAACGGFVLAARWLTRHVPVTGPIDTALTPLGSDAYTRGPEALGPWSEVRPGAVDLGHVTVGRDPRGWLDPEAAKWTIDPRGPEIPLTPDVRRVLYEQRPVRPADECQTYGHCDCWAHGEACCGCGVTAGPGKAYNDGR